MALSRLQGHDAKLLLYSEGILIKLTILGQCRSGKNNMLVLRNGMHIPKKEFVHWRTGVLAQLKAQYNGDPIAVPCTTVIHYFAGDKRRRDEPGLTDAAWHTLERAGIIKDDALLEDKVWRTSYDKENPRMEILIFMEKIKSVRFTKELRRRMQ